MYEKILIAYNGTAESRSALNECIRLAPGAPTEIHLLAVVDQPPSLLIGEYGAAAALSAEEDLIAAKQKMREELSMGRALLTNAGLRVVSHLEVGEPVNVIGELVDKLGIDLLIVGHSRHKSWAMRWWRGSTDALLIEKIRCSLLIATPSQH
jgi:nucleotide-binding universal stress UspA family protein